MKILAFVDLHGDIDTILQLKKKAKLVDLVVCAGDLTIFQNKIGSILSILDQFSKQVLIIHGNHESKELLFDYTKMFRNIYFIHDQIYEHAEALFLGWGGGGFSQRDLDFEKAMKSHVKKFNERPIVLITHAPPYNTKLDRVRGMVTGNRSIKDFIKNNNIHTAICGHIHENSGKKEIYSNTMIINPGKKGKIIHI